MDFKDKVAIVTGAGSGIGKAVAYAFAEHGASVAVIDINPKTGSHVSDDLVKKGYQSIFVETDVAYQEQTDEMREKVLRAYGKVDILINNAGIEFNDRGNIIFMPYEDMNRILQVNLYGYIHCVRSLVPNMMERLQGGKIVNISSMQGLAAIRPGTSYQVSKSGILGLTNSLSLELSPYKINVNTVIPGAIATEGMGRVDQTRVFGTIDAYRRRIPWGARGFPKDVANLVLFLCSDEAGYITGQHFPIDGGYMVNLTPPEFMPDPASHPVPTRDPDKTK